MRNALMYSKTRKLQINSPSIRNVPLSIWTCLSPSGEEFHVFPETCQWNGWTKHVSWVSDLILPLASSVGRKPRPPSLIHRPVMKPTQSGDENSKPTFTQLPCFSALREDWDRAGERAHATSGQWARFRPSDCYFMLPYYSVSRKCVCNPASILPRKSVLHKGVKQTSSSHIPGLTDICQTRTKCIWPYNF